MVTKTVGLSMPSKTKKTEEPKELIEYFEGFTPKEAAFYLEWLETGNATEAAMQVYDCKNRNSAKALGSAVLTKLNIDNPVKRFCEAHGLDVKTATDKLREGLEATKASNAAILLMKDGKVMKTEEQGLIEVPDYAERREWWDRFMKLMGWMKETPLVAQQIKFTVLDGSEKDYDKLRDDN